MAKRVILILLPLVIGIVIVASVYNALKPTLQLWLLTQVTQMISEKSPYTLKMKKLDWTLFFPGVELQEIELEPKESRLPPIKISEIDASLDILSLLGGRISLSTLFVLNPSIEINLDSFSNSNEKSEVAQLPLKEFFDLLEILPLSRIAIKNGSFIISSERKNFGLILGSSDLLLNFKKNKASAQIDLSNIIVDFADLGEIPLRIQGDFSLTQNNLDFSRLQVSLLDSQLKLQGSLPQFQDVLQQPRANFTFELSSQLDRLNKVLSTLEVKIPPLSGQIESSGNIDFEDLKGLRVGLKLSTQSLKIDQYDLGKIQTQAQLQNEQVKISRFELVNEAGKINLSDLIMKLNLNSQNVIENISAKFNTSTLDMQLLMKSLGLGILPIDAYLKADGECSGGVMPSLELECKAQLKGRHLEVRTGPKATNILLHLNEMNAEGGLKITNKDVRYNAKLSVGDDTGLSDGVVSFKEGFKINYSTPRLQMKNVAILAGLNLEGSGKIEGRTEGDSHAATFAMNLETQNFFFENFFLGSPKGKMSYKSGHLYFNDVDSQFSQSNYKADIEVDLTRSRIKATAEIPKFEINELLTIFQRIFVSPISLTGTGSARATVEGPFSLGQLSYDLSTNIIRGSMVGESFDRLDLALHSENGNVQVQKALLVKAKNQISATGTADPHGQINIFVAGKKLSLEESDNIAKMGSEITGNVDVDAHLTGFVLNPDLKLKGQISQLIVEEREFQNSQFNLSFEDRSFQGKVSLFGDQLLTEFKIPTSPHDPFSLALQAKRWNYTTLFALIGGGVLLNEYEASLTGKISLFSETGGLWNSTGSGLFSELFLQRGSLSLKNNKPIEIEMENGKLSFKQFLVTGDQTFISLDANSLSKDNFAMSLNGQANLRLLQIFTPFLEELSGSATFTANTSGTLFKPEILGQASIRNGFAKLKGFPHAFEKITSDIQFSQSKILINAFNGALAGGTFAGDGAVTLEGPQNIPTSVKAKISNVSLNLPDKVRTTGDGEIIFSGNWFPFTLAGVYNVSSGFVDKELDSEGGNLYLKQSSYLPKVVLKSAFEPILLDININIPNPLIIKNSLVDGAVTGNLQVKGAPAHIALGGQLTAEKGTKALFKEKTFEVQNATVKFTGESEINPELFVSARSRISDYDVSMLIQGFAKDPNIKLSSVPPLSDSDLRTLLVMGVTSQSLEKSSGTVTSEKVNKGIAAGLITQFQPVKQLQKTTGVEIQIYATDDTKAGSVQKVTLSKKISDKVKASATQSTGAKTQSNEYILQYNFTDSLSAVGRYEDRKYLENGDSLGSTNKQDENIMGLDLEYKKEFK